MNNSNAHHQEAFDGRRRMSQQQQQQQGWSQEARKIPPTPPELPSTPTGHRDTDVTEQTQPPPPPPVKFRGSEPGPGPWFFALTPRAFEASLGPVLARSQKVWAENTIKMKCAIDG